MSNHNDSPVSDVAWRNPDREVWCTCCGHRHVKAAEAFDPGEHIEFISGTHVACLHRDGKPMVPLTEKQVTAALHHHEIPMTDPRNQDWD